MDLFSSNSAFFSSRTQPYIIPARRISDFAEAISAGLLYLCKEKENDNENENENENDNDNDNENENENDNDNENENKYYLRFSQVRRHTLTNNQ